MSQGRYTESRRPTLDASGRASSREGGTVPAINHASARGRRALFSGVGAYLAPRGTPAGHTCQALVRPIADPAEQDGVDNVCSRFAWILREARWPKGVRRRSLAPMSVPTGHVWSGYATRRMSLPRRWWPWGEKSTRVPVPMFTEPGDARARTRRCSQEGMPGAGSRGEARFRRRGVPRPRHGAPADVPPHGSCKACEVKRVWVAMMA